MNIYNTLYFIEYVRDPYLDNSYDKCYIHYNCTKKRYGLYHGFDLPIVIFHDGDKIWNKKRLIGSTYTYSINHYSLRKK